MYDCDQCDYKDKREGKLKMHKESIHKKITYSCDQCEYKTKRKEYLPRHIKSIHGEARCACDQCEYKAKRKGFLEKHIESIHGNDKYFNVNIKQNIKDSWKNTLNLSMATTSISVSNVNIKLNRRKT